MQRLTLTVIFSFCVLFCNNILAQNYHVCEVSKDVYIINKNKRTKTPVERKQVINKKDRLEIPVHGYIVLLDSASRKSYRIDKPCNEMLGDIIFKGKATVEQLTVKYFTYIWKKMCGGQELAINSTKEQRITAAYRDIDSLCTDTTANDTIKACYSSCKMISGKEDECLKAQCKDTDCKKTQCKTIQCRNAQCAQTTCKKANDCPENSSTDKECKKTECDKTGCKTTQCTNVKCGKSK
ncbi:hypothetical protein [Xylanibacter muris]|uniref:Uncharacterized protein n=1 Tax=Xylanibacter muris TaxID=2736290 RepID=A0ABX2AP31_9BACT|nr:hypothetical protein [Xylanibacter muris]NPD91930.1 hypothetical protein [Xylanibacter muris]